MADEDGLSVEVQDKQGGQPPQSDDGRLLRAIAEVGADERPGSADRLVHDLEDQVRVSVGQGAGTDAAVASLLFDRVERVIDIAPAPIADELRQALVRRAYEAELEDDTAPRHRDRVGREPAGVMAGDEEGRYAVPERIRRAEQDLRATEEAAERQVDGPRRNDRVNRIEAADGARSEQADRQVEEFVELVREPTRIATASDRSGLLSRLRDFVSRRDVEVVGQGAPDADEATIPEALRRWYGVHVSDDQRKIELFETGAKAAAITLDSRSISTPHNEGAVIAHVVALARDRGWQTLKVDGTAEFKEVIWLEATKVGLAVTHQPSPATLAAYEKWNRERPENRAQRAPRQGTEAQQQGREDLGTLFAARSPEERLADPRLRNAHLELVAGIRTAEKELGRSIGELPEVRRALTAAVGQRLSSGKVFEAPFLTPDRVHPTVKQINNPTIDGDKIPSQAH